MIAATMLAVPATALAFMGSTAADAQPSSGSLPISVSPRQASLGEAVTVTGATLSSSAGDRVVLQTRLGESLSWRDLKSTTIGDEGRFRFTVHLSHSGVVRVVSEPVATAASSSSGGAAAVTIPGAARTARVSVAADLRVSSRSRDVLEGETIRIPGRVLPVASGREISLQGRSGRGWNTLAHATTGPSGTFGIRYRPAGGTNHRLRVLFAGDRANARSVAPAGSVTVYRASQASYYDDAGATACGFHARLGVANRTLPCGSKVKLRIGGRAVMATVDDRGPYVGDREWDLNQTTAAALHFAGVGTVWASVR